MMEKMIKINACLGTAPKASLAVKTLENVSQMNEGQYLAVEAM
jgi:hypothetical protein